MRIGDGNPGGGQTGSGEGLPENQSGFLIEELPSRCVLEGDGMSTAISGGGLKKSLSAYGWKFVDQSANRIWMDPGMIDGENKTPLNRSRVSGQRPWTVWADGGLDTDLHTREHPAFRIGIDGYTRAE